MLAHIITLAMLPIISRLYTQESFGYLAVLLSLSGVLASIIMLRLELSVFNTDNAEELSHAFIAALKIGICFFIVLQIAAFSFGSYGARLLEVPSEVIYFVPSAAFLLALFNLLSNISVIQERYKLVAKVKVIRSVALAGIQVIVCSWSKGLVFAEVISRLFGMLQLGKSFFLQTKKYRQSFVLIKTVQKFKNFLKFSVLSGGVNTLSMQLPSLFIAYHFGAVAAGVYLMTNRIIAIPLALAGQSMSQVFSSKLKGVTEQHQRLLFMNQVVGKGLLISIALFTFIVVSAPLLIPIVLGKSWQPVSDFLLYLAPMFCAQLAVFPINNVLNMLNKQKVLLAWDIARISCLLLCCFISIYYSWSIDTFLVCYSGVMLAFYAFLYLITRRELINAS